MNLHDTSTIRLGKGDNVAKSYQARLDDSSSEVSPPELTAGEIMQGSAGVVSPVSDLLSVYDHFLTTWKHQTETNSTSTPGSPFKDVRMMLQSHVPIAKDSAYTQDYGMALATSDLPAPLGSIGTNSMYVSEMPVVGKGSPKRRVWHHNGSLVGFFSSLHILPDDGTAIVVLTNSLANNDCADWIGQYLLETVLDNPDPNDYVKLAQESADKYKSLWTDLRKSHDDDRVPNTSHRPISEYCGSYYNSIGNWRIEVKLESGGLVFEFQGLSEQTYHLTHYNYDTFSWLITPEESIARGRWPDLDKSVYLFKFNGEEGKEITSLTWSHEWAVPSGETFTKQQTANQDHEQQKPLTPRKRWISLLYYFWISYR